MDMWHRISQLGFLGALRCLYKKIYFHYLSKKYGFDGWHATAPFECRPYKAEVVKLANTVRATSAVEIGCGLGDIISKVDAGRRLGVDIDQAVIRAARDLYGHSCAFEIGSLTDIKSLQKCLRQSDLLIMVNWPHLFAWVELANYLRAVIECIGIQYLVIDGINASSHGYAYHHDLQDIEQIGEVVQAVQASDGARTLYLVHVSSLN